MQFTKAALKSALLKILKTKPIGKVTIKELCEKAGLNRGTFYLHYHEPNDVLREMEEDFIEEYVSQLSTYLNPKHPTDHLSVLFASMLQNRDLAQVLMGPHGAPHFAGEHSLP